MALVTARDFQLTPDILGNIQRGLQTVGQFQQLQGVSRAQDLNEQTQLLIGQMQDPSLPPEQRAQSQQKLNALDPKLAQQFQAVQRGQVQGFTEREEAVLKSVSRASDQALALPTDKSRLDFLNRRKQESENQGVSIAEIQEAIDLFESGQVEEANALLQRTVEVGQRAGFIKPAEALDLKREALDLRKSEAALRALEIQEKRETNVLRREEIGLKIEEKRNKIDKTQKDIVIGRQQALDTTDNALAAVDRLLTHPGLESAVGTSSLLPSVPGTERANFEAELASFDAKLFGLAIKQMKGMGSLSDAEGKKVSAAAGAINQKMSEKAFRKSLTIIKENFDLAKSRTLEQVPETPQTQQAPPQVVPQQLNFDAQGNLIQ